VPIDRKAALDYAKKFWNRVTDDDRIPGNAVVLLDDRGRRWLPPRKTAGRHFCPRWLRRRERHLPADSRGQDGRQARPHRNLDELDDCTHYVCRCLLKGEITFGKRPGERADGSHAQEQRQDAGIEGEQDEGQKAVDGMFKPRTWSATTPSKKAATPMHGCSSASRPLHRRSRRHFLPYAVLSVRRRTDQGLEYRRRRRLLVPA
jgi:hypothetical protein